MGLKEFAALIRSRSREALIQRKADRASASKDARAMALVFDELAFNASEPQRFLSQQEAAAPGQWSVLQSALAKTNQAHPALLARALAQATLLVQDPASLTPLIYAVEHAALRITMRAAVEKTGSDPFVILGEVFASFATRWCELGGARESARLDSKAIDSTGARDLERLAHPEAPLAESVEKFASLMSEAWVVLTPQAKDALREHLEQAPEPFSKRFMAAIARGAAMGKGRGPEDIGPWLERRQLARSEALEIESALEKRRAERAESAPGGLRL